MLSVLIISFFAMLAIGVPIAVCLGAAAALAMIVGDIPLLILAQRFFQGMYSFTFLAIPLFLLAGNLMMEAKLSERLVALADLFFGKYHGGMAHVTTVSSAFFGAISGSAPATTAAVGAVMIPSMIERKYAPDDAAAVVAASGALGLIIPPSITMVIYGVITGVSIGEMFINGVVPGILIAIALMAVNYLIARYRHRHAAHAGSVVRGVSRRDVFRASILALMMPVIIIGGIYSGVFTATESAAVACLYGVIVGVLFYRTLTPRKILKAIRDTVINTAIIMFLIMCANAFAYVITIEQVPQMLAAWIGTASADPSTVMLYILLILLIAGMFLENVAALVLLVPTLLPIIKVIGIDPTYFGVFMIIALAVGQFTPPVGLNLFISASLAKRKIETVSLAIIPYIAIYIVLLIVFIYVPNLLLLSRW